MVYIASGGFFFLSWLSFKARGRKATIEKTFLRLLSLSQPLSPSSLLLLLLSFSLFCLSVHFAAFSTLAVTVEVCFKMYTRV